MNLALFDFDGTITASDTWTAFMHFAVRPSRMLAGRIILIPVFVGYRLGTMSGKRSREIVNRVAFGGEPAAAVRELGRRYATTVIPTTVRRSVLERIEWHRSQGDTVVVVSASLDVYLKPWCEARGLTCICTTLEEHRGRLTGRCLQGECSGAEKARRINERYNLADYTLVYAYGDSADDQEMLKLAHKKYYRGKELAS